MSNREEYLYSDADSVQYSNKLIDVISNGIVLKIIDASILTNVNVSRDLKSVDNIEEQIDLLFKESNDLNKYIDKKEFIKVVELKYKILFDTMKITKYKKELIKN